MLALIDLDPLPYAYGGITYDDGTVLSDSMLRKMVDDKITEIVEHSGSEDWIGYLSDSDSNFRNNLATILPYKGNRSGNAKPAKHQMLRDYLMDAYPEKVEMIYGMEADDALSIKQMERWKEISYCLDNDLIFPSVDEFSDITIICTIDKDLDMVPGWHYCWSKGQSPEKEPWFQTEIGGLRFFYKQLLTGDMTDNIRGLYGVGKKSALLTKLDDMDTEEEMFLHVHEEYKKRFGNYADQFMLENGQLLWMLQDKDEMWELPTITREEENDELHF